MRVLTLPVEVLTPQATLKATFTNKSKSWSVKNCEKYL